MWTALNLTADLCWRLPNAQLSLGSKTSEIVLASDGKWRLADDDGEKVELLTGAANGDNDGEHWKITTTDGTQYWFGRMTMPNGKGNTNSTPVVPVYANHAGEPCYSSSSAAASRCQQAWRWMLDYIVDRNGNEVSFWYGRSTVRTGLMGSASSTVAYHRDVYLQRIEYGTRTGQASTVSAPARVFFANGVRCFTTACGTHNKANWPDTPWDLECTAAPCSNNLSPSFWTSVRVSAIRTEVLSGGSYQPVDEWAIDGSFPSTGSGMSPVLWLSSITRTGKTAGGSQALPSLLTYGTRMQNRADFDPDASMASHMKYRITRIRTESGGEVEVAYSGDDANCTFGSTFPNHTANPRRCFPQWYTNPSGQSGWSWWHKRIVTQIVERDPVGGSPEVVHQYQYSTGGSNSGTLWAHSNGAAVWGSSLPTRTWADWRGYSKVTVLSGPPDGLRSRTDYLYFRGLHGDRASMDDDSTRTVTLTEFNGTVWNDVQQYAGELLNTTIYDGAGGTAVQVTRSVPWSAVTGTRTLTRDWAVPMVHRSYIVRTGGTSRWEWVNGAWSARTSTTDTWHTIYGRRLTSADAGSLAVTGDDTCTRYSYADNSTTYKYGFVSQVQVAKGSCTTAPVIPNDLVSDERYFYDGQATHGAAPGRGNITKTEAYGDGWTVVSQNVVYDPYGRMTSTTDGLNRTTGTAYTHNADGLLTGMAITDAAGHTTTTTVDPVRGLPLAVTDANGKVTTGRYDPLGRLVKTWGAGRSTSDIPDAEFTYQISSDAPSWVASKVLGPNGNQITSYEIYDGRLRLRQTQTPTAGGKRAITDIRYDARGLAVAQSQLYNATSGPTSTLVTFADSAVHTQHRYSYDGRDRVTADELWSRDVMEHRTTTAYEWDRTTVTPPVGGTTVTDILDDLGRVVEKRQHHQRDAAGGYDTTRYGYSLRDELTTVTDPAGNQWAWTYDLLGRQTGASDPDKGATTMTYDAAGQLIRTTDGRGQQLHVAYDTLGRKTTLRKNATDGPVLAEWTYDTLAKGQLTSATRHVDGKAYVTAVTGYDDAYRPLGASVTVPPGEGELSGTWTVQTSYKANGAVASLTYPAAGGLAAETADYVYTDTGFLNSITGQDTYLADADYYWHGQVKQRTLGSGDRRIRLTTTFDEATRRLSAAQTHTENPTTPGTWDERLSLEYGYDQAGNVTSIAETAAGATVSRECFGYDRLRRLAQAWTTTAGACQGTPQDSAVGGPDPYWHSYAYDVVGNRTTETVHGVAAGAATVQRDYSYPAAGGAKPHALTSVTGPAGTDSFTYDATGNTTRRDLAGKPGQTLTWDAEGRLATVVEGDQTTSYVYDADGNRLIRRTPAGATLYLGATEIHSTAAGVKCVRYYSHGDTVIASRTTSAALSWHADDHHGTAQVTVAANDLSVQRRRQTPFGQSRGTPPDAWPVERGFVGGTQDPTGLVHLGAREYDPSVGRFVSVDPVLDLADPQQMQGYSYANNNPTTLVDPDGEKPLATSGGGAEEDRYWKSGGGKDKKLVQDPKTKKWKVVNKKPKDTDDERVKPEKKRKKEKAEPKNAVEKTASFVAEWAKKIGDIVSWIPFCAWCATIVVALGVIAAIAYAVMGQWGNAIKAIIGAGLNALLGGLKITKSLEYLEGGASGVVAREILVKLQPYGYKATQTVFDFSKKKWTFLPTWTNRLVNQGLGYIGNVMGNILNSMIPPQGA